MYTRILAALDETPRAAKVLETSTHIAECFGGWVYPFRAVQVPQEFPPAAAMDHADPLPAHLMAAARAAVARLGRANLCPRIFPPIVRIGTAWRSILDEAQAVGADLVVMGSHAYGGLDYLVGTNAGRVAALAQPDVLVVSDRAPARVDTLLVAMDADARTNSAVVARAFALSRAFDARLRVVRAGSLRAVLDAASEAGADLVVASSAMSHLVDEGLEQVLVVHAGPPPARSAYR
jgi:nucleotide-binding universal stress UspA family protein